MSDKIHRESTFNLMYFDFAVYIIHSCISCYSFCPFKKS